MMCPASPNKLPKKRKAPSDSSESGKAAKKPQLTGVDLARAHLNEEIAAFTTFASLTREEQRARSLLKKRVFGLVRELWPKATMKQFGSHETGLEWFESDVDLRVSDALTSADEACLALHDVLAAQDWVQSIEARPQARIPIVCFRDAMTDVDVDVSFEDVLQFNDSAGANYFSSPHRHFHDVVILLKALFKPSPALSMPFHGGLGSFRLCVLVDHFLKTSTSDANLDSPADALVAFLRFCGTDFDKRCSLFVSAPDGQSLRVAYGNVNSGAVKRACQNALAVLIGDEERPETDRLPRLFAVNAWNKLIQSRKTKLQLARTRCREAKTPTIPPPPDLYTKARSSG